MNEGKETNAERAIKLLKERGALRTRGIADALGLPIADVGVYMRKLEEAGAVVSCEVAVPGTPPQKEWRLSAGGKPVPFTIGRAKVLAASPRKTEAQEAAKPAPKPRKAPKPAPAHPRGARRIKAVRQVQRNTAKRLPVAEVPWKEERPAAGSLARLGHPPGTGLRFGVFSDGTLEIVLADGQRVEIAAPDARRLVEYLDRSLLREAA